MVQHTDVHSKLLNRFNTLMSFPSFSIDSCIDTDIWHSGLTSISCEDGVCGMALYRTGNALVQFQHCHDALRLLRRSELASKGDSVGAEPAMLFDNEGDDCEEGYFSRLCFAATRAAAPSQFADPFPSASREAAFTMATSMYIGPATFGARMRRSMRASTKLSLALGTTTSRSTWQPCSSHHA